jgi:carboxymethylenebutenolidase
MIAQQIEIRTSDGISDGFIYSPRESSRVPGIIFLTDIAGIRPSQCEMAQRLAGEGYIRSCCPIFSIAWDVPRWWSFR